MLQVSNKKKIRGHDGNETHDLSDREETISTESANVRIFEEQGHFLSSYMGRVLYTVSICNVDSERGPGMDLELFLVPRL